MHDAFGIALRVAQLGESSGESAAGGDIGKEYVACEAEEQAIHLELVAQRTCDVKFHEDGSNP